MGVGAYKSMELYRVGDGCHLRLSHQSQTKHRCALAAEMAQSQRHGLSTV